MGMSANEKCAFANWVCAETGADNINKVLNENLQQDLRGYAATTLYDLKFRWSLADDSAPSEPTNSGDAAFARRVEDEDCYILRMMVPVDVPLLLSQSEPMDCGDAAFLMPPYAILQAKAAKLRRYDDRRRARR